MEFKFDLREIIQQLESTRGEQAINVYIRDQNIVETILSRYLGMSYEEFEYEFYYFRKPCLKITFQLADQNVLEMLISAHDDVLKIDEAIEILTIKYRKKERQ